jgi:hypothetical protein
MSKITDIYNAWVALITAELPSYRRLPNPYAADANANVILNKGFGIAVGGGTNTERNLGCKLSISRDFGIILTKQIAKTDHDTSGRADQEKALFEDQYALIKAVEQDPDLGGTAAKAYYVSDGGLEILDLETGRYFVLATQFNVEYFETLT